jgi:hypothetical protein
MSGRHQHRTFDYDVNDRERSRLASPGHRLCFQVGQLPDERRKIGHVQRHLVHTIRLLIGVCKVTFGLRVRATFVDARWYDQETQPQHSQEINRIGRHPRAKTDLTRPYVL